MMERREERIPCGAHRADLQNWQCCSEVRRHQAAPIGYQPIVDSRDDGSVCQGELREICDSSVTC